jgi:1,6-anhydro-N-acetylmuramate kinase
MFFALALVLEGFKPIGDMCADDLGAVDAEKMHFPNRLAQRPLFSLSRPNSGSREVSEMEGTASCAAETQQAFSPSAQREVVHRPPNRAMIFLPS